MIYKGVRKLVKAKNIFFFEKKKQKALISFAVVAVKPAKTPLNFAQIA